VGSFIKFAQVFLRVDDAGFVAFLKNVGLPEVMIPMLTATKAAVREGVLEIESNDLETLLQRPVAPINEALNRLVGSLKK
jgi:NAD(P)H dehydrogenase (quinone)